MDRYRAFILNKEDRIVSARIIEAESDKEAWRLVKECLPKGRGAELWQGARCVGKTRPSEDS